MPPPILPDLAPPAHPVERLPHEWEAELARLGEPRYRGAQIFDWIYRKGVLDPERMTNLPRRLRGVLAREGLGAPLQEVRALTSDDGTRKLIVRTADERDVETVLIPQLVSTDPGPDVDEDAAVEVDEEEAEADRAAGLVPGDMFTQCISSQVGCAMGCVFCASGVAGLRRNLTAAEIACQVLLGQAGLEGRQRVRNVVLMGMGEPLHNYGAVARALVLLTHPEGMALSRRRVTLSTSGLVPQIDRLAADFGGQVQLAVSLHAVDDRRRSELMPINRKHPLTDLLACLRRYPLPRRGRITIEYTLMAGVNDSMDDADRLVGLLRGLRAKVNLIPMNPIDGSALSAPDLGRIIDFQERLAARGISVFVRRRRGDDIDAACGQLALRGDPRLARGRGSRTPPDAP